jgi:general secretion pathway protein J
MMWRDRAGGKSGHADHGFTLIELLVSLTILALLMALVPNTLKLGRRAWETPGGFDQASDAAAALAFVEVHVKGAMPVFERDARNLQRIAFWGGAETLAFVAPMNSGPYGSGLYKIEAGALGGTVPGLRISLYSTENAGTRTALVVDERTLGLKGPGGSGYKAIRFRYFGPPGVGETPRWLEQWPRLDRLPDLIEFAVSPRDTAKAQLPNYRAELRLRPVP